MDITYAVYMLASRKNGTLYIGVTGDLVARVGQHKAGENAGFTRKYGVKRLVWFELHGNPQDAIIREKRLKKWKRDWKISLVEENNPDWDDLHLTLT